MTTHRPSLQDEFLADLRVAAPIPVLPPAAERPHPPVPEARADEDTPTLQLRLTPWHWARPAVRNEKGEQHLELSAGPLRISVTGFDR